MKEDKFILSEKDKKEAMRILMDVRKRISVAVGISEVILFGEDKDE